MPEKSQHNDKRDKIGLTRPNQRIAASGARDAVLDKLADASGAGGQQGK